MRIIITGGAGFIGGHAYEHFTSLGDEVLVVDKLTYASNSRLASSIQRLERVDVCDSERLDRVFEDFDPDIVVNFAAETHVDNSISSSREFVVTNVLGTASVLDACKKHSIRLCHISTDEVYGPATCSAFKEDGALSPQNPYSATKAAADLMIQSYGNTHGLPYLIVRPSNNYGPRQHSEKLIPKLLKCLSTGTRFPLYGTGDQIREWTYVVDTVSSIRRLIEVEKDWHSIYNLSSGTWMTNIQTIEAVVTTYNSIHSTKYCLDDIIQRVEDRKGHDRRYWIDSSKINEALLGNLSFKSFAHGIFETVNRYKADASM